MFTDGIYPNSSNPPDFLNEGDDVADLEIDPQGPIPEVECLTSEVHVPQVCANIPDGLVRELKLTVCWSAVLHCSTRPHTLSMLWMF